MGDAITVVAIDTGVELSERAASALSEYKAWRRGEAPDVLTVVRVPRVELDRVQHLSWAELKQLAHDGERGLSLYGVVGIERAPVTEAWMEDCPSKGLNKGRCCPYSQGWDANTPALVKK